MSIQVAAPKGEAIGSLAVYIRIDFRSSDVAVNHVGSHVFHYGSDAQYVP